MNRYGQMLMEHNRRHRPQAFAQIADPVVFFDREGEAVAADVSAARDELLGAQRQGEDLESYRLRSYQALRTAEELILTDHPLLAPEEERAVSEDRQPVDQELEHHRRRLAIVNEALRSAQEILKSDEADPEV